MKLRELNKLRGLTQAIEREDAKPYPNREYLNTLHIGYDTVCARHQICDVLHCEEKATHRPRCIKHHERIAEEH